MKLGEIIRVRDPVFVSVATEGLKPETDRVLLIDCLRPGEEAVRFFIDGGSPGRTAHISGLSEAMYRAEAVPAKDALKGFSEFVKGRTPVGHGFSRFAHQFLNRMRAREGILEPLYGDWLDTAILMLLVQGDLVCGWSRDESLARNQERLRKKSPQATLPPLRDCVPASPDYVPHPLLSSDNNLRTVTLYSDLCALDLC